MNFVKYESIQKTNNDDNLIPLINVVFLMLIFFMVAGVIRTQEPENISLPVSSSKQPIVQEQYQIFLTKMGEVVFQGQTLNGAMLRAALEEVIHSTADIQSLRLSLFVDQTVPAEQLYKVLKEIRNTGLLKVNLLTQQGASHE